MDGKVVQLQQGERLALSSDDVDGWIEKFSPFQIVQLIDLDAAMGRPANDELVRYIATRLPCQVGGTEICELTPRPIENTCWPPLPPRTSTDQVSL